MATKIQTGLGISTSDNTLLKGGGLNFDTSTLFLDIGTKFVHLLEGVTVIIIGMIAIRLIRGYLQKVEVQHESQRMALNLLEKLISGFLTVITITLGLNVIGLDLTLLISSIALGLSFGLQDIIKDYVSGILILFKSPFSIGDIISVKSYLGRVEKIDFQSTTLKTFDQKVVTVFNKDILAQAITNYSKEPMRRLEIGLTLGRGSDTAKAMAIFETILDNNPKVLKNPRYSIVFHKFWEQGMRVVIRFWVNRPCNILSVRSEIALQIEQAFDENSILSPYGRQIQFTQDISMNEGRKHRIQSFLSLPMMATIADQTANKLKEIFSVPQEMLVDREEPEYQEG